MRRGVDRPHTLVRMIDDVNLETNVVTIRASLSQTKAGVSEKTTKTNRVRRVELVAGAVEALRRQRSMQNQERLAAGVLFGDTGHVFQTSLGGTITPYAATDGFREIAKRAKVIGRGKTLHSLRHTAASWLLASGVDVVTVAAILGHSSPVATLSVYGHVVAWSPQGLRRRELQATRLLHAVPFPARLVPRSAIFRASSLHASS
jgi:integrase